MLPNSVVFIPQGVPEGGIWLLVAVGIGCPRHNGIVAPGISFPQKLPVMPGIGLVGSDQLSRLPGFSLIN